MNVLAIDTSNHVLGVSLLKDQKVIGETVTDVPVNHSVRLMPVITQFMEEINIKAEDLDLIVVAKGPGSYTGVRVGITTAKTLAWALQIPIVAVSSLEALAYEGRFFNGMICPFYDARRQTVFTGLYEWNQKGIQLIQADQNVHMTEWLALLKQQNKQVLFLSSDIKLYEDMIMEYLGDLAIIPEMPYHLPRTSLLGLAGLNKESEELHTLTPNYLRLAEAEAKWLQAQQQNQDDK
ncbi:tRNA (adenosine(37)-N6)-threonylcarbamoyltransferase complex dimerization subunit type 1 TsaB [Ornithinibacillus sp. 4-3]|uniref:tRNA (Adenosine(37)-N6)-threonylcarbamoyltransferase complex dimerization subunit type 1 TsaB n=1 Tax=Ornithinibacillus sp. 4-3 TaxID=3231488 RepID=A0AB39HT17_9BACI